MKKRNFFLVATLSLAFLVSPTFFGGFPQHSAQAQLSAAAGIPFGGMASTILPCPCNGARLVTYGAPVPTVLLAFEGTPIYSFGMTASSIHPGQWGLGLEMPGGACLSVAKCAPIPAKGTLMINFTGGRGMLGTSI